MIKLHYIWLFPLLLFSTVIYPQGPHEQEKPKPVTRILFVFDASQSMYGRWQSDTKFNIASRLFSNILDSLKMLKILNWR